MQIDRARFLLLTASLAGGGCAPASPDPVTPPEPTSVPTSTEPEVTVPETPDPATTSGETTSSPPATTSEPDPPADPPTSGCDNDTGTVPSCSISKPPGPFCEGFNETRSACKGLKTALRGGVAAKAVACLNAASGSQAICDYSLNESCVGAAIRTACIQPSLTSECSSIVSQCSANQWGNLPMQDCQKLLSAVSSSKRKSMVTCMIEGCSLDSCTWMLR